MTTCANYHNTERVAITIDDELMDVDAIPIMQRTEPDFVMLDDNKLF
jgi:hypothetical protein